MNTSSKVKAAMLVIVVGAADSAARSGSAAGLSRQEPPPRTTDGRRSSLADQTDGGGCTRRFDHFRNRNTVAIEPRTIYSADDEELRMGASASVEANGNIARREIELLFDSTANRLRYGNSAEVRFIVDGKRVEAGTAYKSGGSAMRRVNERLRLTISASRFLEIAAGSEVGMQVGETEVTLRGEALELLHGFAVCLGLRPEQRR